MPRVCTICTHERRLEIDRALIAEEALRDIARRYATSKDALARHREHIPKRLSKAREAEEIAQAETLLDKLKELNAETRAILQETREAQDHDLSLKALTRLEKQLELEAKLLGELQPDGATVNIYQAPEWLTLRAVVLQALLPYPDAARAVGKALSEPN